MNAFKNCRILLGVTGGIAAYKSPEIVRIIVKNGGQVKVILTAAGEKFITRTTLETVSGNRVGLDLFPVDGNYDPVHINYARWCDAMLIAPATANIIAKAARGIADDLMSSVLLAVEKPIFIAPAMNSSMYRHPAVIENLEILRSRGVQIMEPEIGPLASRMEGNDIGRMPEPAQIVEWMGFHLEEPHPDLEGYRVLITAGPTREAIDPIRYITNRSSGKMGIALAAEAAHRGAEVVLVHGRVDANIPKNVTAVPVTTAEEMLNVVKKEYPHCRIAVMAAAVADFKPMAQNIAKVKKSERLTLELVQNPDILKWMGENRKRQFLVGFALEDDENMQEARRKLKEKNANLIVLNTIEAIDSEDNRIILLSSQSEEKFPMVSKRAAARSIFNRITTEIGRGSN
ncbi:MAG: bifunctional phosphopantothenoylcysteine decarboxylase/phosphopantothenate--cysteine ligase CoaBC [candidate division Zixibacteria bacterium]|nr:bifunctional phosphopantothenoylcysteine decarboxylase/phosphopantothenate--cysteine ligase CoaBC [Candidatus Tariuqbacter arcticus]